MELKDLIAILVPVVFVGISEAVKRLKTNARGRERASQRPRRVVTGAQGQLSPSQQLQPQAAAEVSKPRSAFQPIAPTPAEADLALSAVEEPAEPAGVAAPELRSAIEPSEGKRPMTRADWRRAIIAAEIVNNKFI